MESQCHRFKAGSTFPKWLLTENLRTAKRCQLSWWKLQRAQEPTSQTSITWKACVTCMFPNISNGSSFPHHLHKPPSIMPPLSFLHCLACKSSSSPESNHVAMLTDNTYAITRANSSFLQGFSKGTAIQFWISNRKDILVIIPWQNTKIT